MSLDACPSNDDLLRIKAEREGRSLPPEVIITQPGKKSPRKTGLERMNKTEKAFAQRLEASRRTGQIASWDFEAITFKLGHDCRYTPDFMVRELNDAITFHETKGFMRDDALVKIRTFAKQYRFPIYVWKREQGEWSSTNFTHAPDPLLQPVET